MFLNICLDYNVLKLNIFTCLTHTKLTGHSDGKNMACYEIIGKNYIKIILLLLQNLCALSLIKVFRSPRNAASAWGKNAIVSFLQVLLLSSENANLV